MKTTSRLIGAGALALALLAAGAAAAPAAAQTMLGQMFTTHAYMGAIDLRNLYDFSDDTEVEQLDGALLGGQAGFGVTTALSVLANYAVNSTMLYLSNDPDDPFGEAYAHEILLWDVNLQLRRPFWHEQRFNPLLQVGAGQIRTSTAPGHATSEQDVRVAPAYNAGVGFDLQFGNAFGVRMMAKDYVTTATWESTVDPQFNYTAGEVLSHNLAYHIGITLGF